MRTGLVLHTSEGPEQGLFQDCELGVGGTSSSFLMEVVWLLLLPSAGPGAQDHSVEPSLEKLERARGAPSTLPRSERVAEPASGIFGLGLRHYPARLLAPPRQRGPMSTNAVQDPAQVTVPPPRPKSASPQGGSPAQGTGVQSPASRTLGVRVWWSHF